MHTLYGSTKSPKNIFGDGTPEIKAFYEALQQVCPGACYYLSVFADAWQPYTDKHSWVLPDDHHAHVWVTDDIESSLEIDELDHRTFKYTYEDRVPSKTGVSLIANVIHSIDGYVMRSLFRRCTHHGHNTQLISDSLSILWHENLRRANGAPSLPAAGSDSSENSDKPLKPKEQQAKERFWTLVQRFADTGMPDTSIFEYLTFERVQHMTQGHIEKLGRIAEGMLEHPAFDLAAVHDEFKCNANDVNWMRHHYRSILADLSESHILTDILSTVTHSYAPFSTTNAPIGDLIRQGDYAIC